MPTYFVILEDITGAEHTHIVDAKDAEAAKQAALDEAEIELDDDIVAQGIEVVSCDLLEDKKAA